MDVKESYRVLELEVGASRAAVDAAYCQLLERWHPNRVASGDPEAVREAQRRVQEINNAYQTLAEIAPASAKPAAPQPTQSAAASALEPAPTPDSASAAPMPGAKPKPKLPPLVGGQPSLGRSIPPPPPPPPETWTTRSAPVASAPPQSPSAPPAPPAALSAPPSTKSLPPQPTLPAPPPATSTPPLAPTANPGPAAPEPSSAPPTFFAEFRSLIKEFYNTLFPLGSPRRRWGPVIVTVAVVVVLLLAKSAFLASATKRAQNNEQAAQIVANKLVGRLAVKSNLATTTLEATRLPAAGETAAAAIKGSDEGAAEQTLSDLPPGKYLVTAHSPGWPDVREEVIVAAEHRTELSINFKGGSLRLDSDPAGATVRLGSATLGRTPLVIPQLPPGECVLSLKYPGWPPASFTTTITAGMEATGSIRMPQGKLTIESRPTGATVLFGGASLGVTPLKLDQFPAGIRKLTLRAKDFPPLEVSVTLEDHGEGKINPVLGSGFPVLDPTALLRNIWVPDDPDKIAPPNDGVTGPYQAQNGIVRNLNRRALFGYWLNRPYCITGVVKSYDPASGLIEFTEQQNDLSKYRIRAKLSTEVRQNPDLPAQLAKGATFSLYGTLSAVEEPRWPFKVITFDFSAAEPLR